jgi:hypothetical protein
MTRNRTITKNPLTLLLAGLAAIVSIAFTAGQAEAATPGTVAATCYSDGYITVSDGGNVASAPQFLRLKIAHRTTLGWRWQTYAWRPVNGGSFRLNATRGGQFYIYATIATRTDSGFSYSSDYVSVTNVKVSPIGAVTVAARTKGFCQT